MAESLPPGYDVLIECPYNKAHQILNHRMQTHLVKCRKAFPEKKLVICPYNTSHHIPEPELKFHKSQCPEKASLDSYHYTIEARNPKHFNRDPVIEHEFVECEENWDNYNVDTYDPTKYVENVPILRTQAVNGMQRAQRKQFRKDELVRINNLD